MDRDQPEEQLTIMEWQTLNRIDPVRKQPEGVLGETKGLSPMDPPDAYAPPSLEPVSPAEMHPFLRRFRDEHVPLMEELNAFEEAIVSIQKIGFTKESDAALRRFFHFIEQEFPRQRRLEEATLFPLLHERLMAGGEHSKGDDPTTAIDVMKNDHAEAMQLAAVVVNFLGLVFRLPDEKSRLIVLDAALEQGKNLVELLRLLVFRKDNVLYSLAHRLISGAEFDRLQSRSTGAGRTN